MAEQLSGRALDAAVHRVLGKKVEHDWDINTGAAAAVCTWCRRVWHNDDPVEPPADEYCIPPYSTDYNAVRLMEDEIERRGLHRDYARQIVLDNDIPWGDLFALVNATAAQRCRAALKALEESNG